MSEIANKLLQNQNFFSSGSRRMAQKHPALIKISSKTDYDFYCANTHENIATLQSMEFERLECNLKNYWDNQLLDIYKNGNVEVLIRKDVNLYRTAFESISAYQFYRYLWKSSPQPYYKSREQLRKKCCAYFNELFDFYQTGRIFEMRHSNPNNLPW